MRSVSDGYMKGCARCTPSRRILHSFLNFLESSSICLSISSECSFSLLLGTLWHPPIVLVVQVPRWQWYRRYWSRVRRRSLLGARFVRMESSSASGKGSDEEAGGEQGAVRMEMYRGTSLGPIQSPTPTSICWCDPFYGPLVWNFVVVL